MLSREIIASLLAASIYEDGILQKFSYGNRCVIWLTLLYSTKCVCETLATFHTAALWHSR